MLFFVLISVFFPSLFFVPHFYSRSLQNSEYMTGQMGDIARKIDDMVGLMGYPVSPTCM